MTKDLKQLIGLLVMVVAATMWISGSLNEIDKRLTRIEDALDNRWSVQDMRIWTMQLGQANESLSVPVPESQEN